MIGNVTLSSIHASLGLECQFVAVPFVAHTLIAVSLIPRPSHIIVFVCLQYP